MLALYQNLDTTSSDNLYNQLFQNRYITSPLNPDFAIANVSPGSQNISADHKAVIIAATGLMPEDLDLLISKTDGILSLNNLSFIYRNNLLAQILSVSINDLFVVQDIINITPGVFDHPSSTYLFTQKFRTFIQSGFSADEINYVLRHQNDAGGSLIASESQIANALSPVQSNLLKIRAATSVVADPQGTVLGKWLADPLLNWDASLVTKLMDILNISDDDEYHDKIDDATNFLMNLRVHFAAPSFAADLGALPAITFPDSLASQISYDNSNKQLKFVGFMSATDQGNLLGLSGDGAYQTAVNNLFAASQQTDNSAANISFNSNADINTLKAITFANVADRFSYFLNIISPVYTELQQTTSLAGQLTSWFTIDNSVSRQLLVSIPDIYTFLYR